MRRFLPISLALLALGTWLAQPVRAQLEGRPPNITVRNYYQLQSYHLRVDQGGKPMYLPREWGRLVAVQPVQDKLVLFLEAESGELHVVSLVVSGNFSQSNELAIDLTNGGMVTVIPRDP
jgi:hypothetical protein